MPIVRAGESLSGIARRELGAARLWPQVFAFNAGRHARFKPLHDPDRLAAGQAIGIPPRTSGRHGARHPNPRHPMQRTAPRIAPDTAAATTAPPPAPVPAPVQQPATVPRAGRALDVTFVNSPAFKRELDALPPIKRHTPAFDYEAKFAGQIILWTDQQVDLLTFTNKGYESAAKAKLAQTLTYLLTSEKVSFDQASRKVSFESLLTTGVVGGITETSVGLVADTSDPRPAFRVKLVNTDQLMGRVAPGTLWVAEKLQITVDVRPNGPPAGGADATGSQGVALPRTGDAVSQQGVALPASPAGAVDAPQVEAGVGSPQTPAWAQSRWAPLYATLMILGVIALEAMTWETRLMGRTPAGIVGPYGGRQGA